VEVEAHRAELEAIAAAQTRGAISRRIEPVDLMAALLGLVTAWANASPALEHLAPQPSSPGRHQAFRAIMVMAVRAPTAP
jgi:hypothetical protein